MKKLNNFIVEHLKYSKFPINEKLKISSKSHFNDKCKNFEDLLCKYSLTELIANNSEKSQGIYKKLKCDDDVFNKYADFFKQNKTDCQNQIEKIFPEINLNIKDVSVSTVDTFNNGVFYNVILTDKEFELIGELLFDTKNHIIKIGLNSYEKDKEKTTNELCKIIDFILEE